MVLKNTLQPIVIMCADGFKRSEILPLIVRLAFFSVTTYFTIKWLSNVVDPTSSQKKKAKKKADELMEKLGISKNISLNEYEVMIASQLVNPADIGVTWDSIAGLDELVEDLRRNVIYPIKLQDLCRRSRLTRPPKGVLLHGPPGCGKTLIAKATARDAGCRFINLDVSILTDKWYGESQKLASAVFSLGMKLQPCIIFIDEIDSLLRARDSHDHEATAMMKAQFMSLWDGLITNDDCTVIIMGATNRPRDVDLAIIRRMPATFHVPLPSAEQRQKILQLVLKTEQIQANVNYGQLAEMTERFSGSDLQELCRTAAVHRMQETVQEWRNETAQPNTTLLQPITMEDLILATEKMKRSKVFSGQSVSLVRADVD